MCSTKGSFLVFCKPLFKLSSKKNTFKFVQRVVVQVPMFWGCWRDFPLNVIKPHCILLVVFWDSFAIVHFFLHDAAKKCGLYCNAFGNTSSVKYFVNQRPMQLRNWEKGKQREDIVYLKASSATITTKSQIEGYLWHWGAVTIVNSGFRFGRSNGGGKKHPIISVT